MANPPWKISVWRKDVVVEEFEVPAHKLGSHEIERFLHAMVVRLSTESLQDMVRYYVNGRRGQPNKRVFDYAGRYENNDLTEIGYWHGGWEIYAKATQRTTEKHRKIILELRAQNTRVA